MEPIAATGPTPILALVLSGVIHFLIVYRWILIVRILLSWIPSINWYEQPWRFLNDITDPAMRIFRGMIPPLGMIDISPIVLFFALSLLTTVLTRICISATGVFCPVGIPGL